MQQNLIDIETISSLDVEWVIGSPEELYMAQNITLRRPFDEELVCFMDTVSKYILADRTAKEYSDIITFAFWIRKASIRRLRERFAGNDYRLGRGTVFHVAPSNVPVNYAYSMAAGLLCGNKNIVRIPSKNYPQIDIINSAILKALHKFEAVKPYVIFVRYGHNKIMNDVFSLLADTRVIWGGDNTINEIRESVLKPRGTEITFSDRYSLAVIDSDAYMKKIVEGNSDVRKQIANDFYNDTYLTDQNACTSPRAIVWLGNCIEEAKDIFWGTLYKLVEQRYDLQGIQAVNKLTSSFLTAATKDGVYKIPTISNKMIRIKVDQLDSTLMELKDNSGYFFEYDCRDIMELQDICNDEKCQTIAYIGNKMMFIPLLQYGVKGIDRIVPLGKTMDFDLIWDGYNLFDRMTRIVDIL